jgi:hypothetical protein
MIDAPNEVLRKAREKRFATAAEAAREYGWNEATYTSHENGTRGIRRDAAIKYASAFGISSALLLGVKGGPETDTLDVIRVVGEAQMGVWRDIALDEEQYANKGSFAIPRIGKTAGVRVAVKVLDDSVNRAIKAGDFAVYAPIEDPDSIHWGEGRFVYIEREESGRVERTIRRVMGTEKDRLKLGFWSTDKKYAGTVTIPSSRPNETVRIIGQVVGQYGEL